MLGFLDRFGWDRMRFIDMKILDVCRSVVELSSINKS